MRAVVDKLDEWLPRANMVRLGTPTPEFLRDYPDVCEDATLQARLEELNREIQGLVEVREALGQLGRALEEVVSCNEQSVALELQIIELENRLVNEHRSVHALQSELAKIREVGNQLGTEELQVGAQIRRLGPIKALLKSAEKKDLDAKLATIRSRRQENSRNKGELEVRLGSLALGKTTLDRQIAEKKSELSESVRKLAVAEETLRTTRARFDDEAIDVEALLAKIESDQVELIAQRSALESTLADKLVIGTTLDGFIGRSQNAAFNVNWVILDEAAYAPLAKVIPLLSLGCPISMFGDHKQLPPVCEAADSDAIPRSFWGKSALFLEVALQATDHGAIFQASSPEFDVLVKKDLTLSFRFGEDLAIMLDQFIYQNGLCGAGHLTTKIYVRQVQWLHLPNLPNRVRVNEVDAVVQLAQNLLETGRDDIAILTPYKRQAEWIRNALRAKGLVGQVEVMNTHRAQGREWETVIFSVVDGSPPYNPYYTDVGLPVGVQVLNTTISRVKKELYLVLEQGYWEAHQHQLLSALIGIANPV